MRTLTTFFIYAVSKGLLICGLLFLVRFVFPAIGMCKSEGVRERQSTVCFNLVEFKGDNLFSMFRISLYKSNRGQ